MRRTRIAFVVQRYGEEINGGAEQHCRQLAERLTDRYDVSVLTTCAKSYLSWENEYPAGETMQRGVTVYRFPCVCQRDQFPDPWVPGGQASAYGFANDMNWMMQQGPVSFQLLQFLQHNREEYDVFLFFTYLYFTTFAGLMSVPERSILIPTAHDEPPIYRDLFRSVFHLPVGIFYNTPEERQFVKDRFHHHPRLEEIGGVGVELPRDISEARFRRKYGLHDPFLLYVGRMTEKKGCHILTDYFIRMKEREPSRLQLVFIGTGEWQPPKREDIHTLGFVSEEDKFDAIKASAMMTVPSFYESLSMVLLEAMSLSVPVLCNGACQVLQGHCRRSNGGVYYQNFEEFVQGVSYLLEHGADMGQNGKVYVKQDYRWEVILNKLSAMIDQIREWNDE